MPAYGVKITDVGLAAFADAYANSTPVELSQMLIGDGNGETPVFTGAETELVNEVSRHPLTLIDKPEPTQIRAKALVPAESGGYTIREVGLVDTSNRLLAVAAYPETVKPPLSDGFGADLNVTLIMEVANAASIVIEDGGSLIYVTTENLVTIMNTYRPTWYEMNW